MASKSWLMPRSPPGFDDCASGFDSPTFALIVGPEEKTFTAHGSFLSQSPVFEKICKSHFRESQTYQIDLPEDEPDTIRAILQYLYAGNFHHYGTLEFAGSTWAASMQLADMYVTAEKYQLSSLKDLVLTKLGHFIDVEERPIDFFSTAKAIYAGTPDTDRGWRTFFQNFVINLEKPSHMCTTVRGVFDRCIAEGGTMAIDIVLAICNDYEAQLRYDDEDDRPVI